MDDKLTVKVVVEIRLPWWEAVLRRDKACDNRRDEYGESSFASYLQCVFCGKDTDLSRRAPSMLGWWRDGPMGEQTLASGLYCHGPGMCSDRAQDRGDGVCMGDLSADAFVGPCGILMMQEVLRDKTLWNPAALRRFCIIGCILGRMEPGSP